MASAALAEKIVRIEDVRRLVNATPEPIAMGAPEVEQLSAMLHEVEDILVWAETANLPDTTEAHEAIAQAQALQRRLARILATVGIDASWGMLSVDHDGYPIYNAIVLSAEDSSVLRDMLENPPEPSEYLKKTIDTYKKSMGR